MAKGAKINVKDKVDDNVCDLSLCELKEVPVKEIVSEKKGTQIDGVAISLKEPGGHQVPGESESLLSKWKITSERRSHHFKFSNMSNLQNTP